MHPGIECLNLTVTGTTALFSIGAALSYSHQQYTKSRSLHALGFSVIAVLISLKRNLSVLMIAVSLMSKDVA